MTDELNKPADSAAGTDLQDQQPDRFEAANKSLADALAVSFRALRWVFVLLLILFLFSGVFTVQQNQVAVRTAFGRITSGANGIEVLTADGGPYFRLPRPIGEVFFIPTTERTLSLNDSFVFTVDPRNAGVRLSELTASGTYDPTKDNLLITGDRNIVHARYDVRYRVRPEGAADFVRNIAGPADGEDFATIADNPQVLFEHAERLLKMVVEEAIVADVATRDIDGFIQGERGFAQPAAELEDDESTPPVDPDTDPETPELPAEDDEPAAETPVDPGTSSGGLQGVTGTIETPSSRVTEDTIKAAAQATLDRHNVGITIEDVTRTDFSPPPVVRFAFEALSNALQDQRRAISQGSQERTRILTQTAGSAFPAAIAIIDTYEVADRQLQANPDDETARQTLAAAETALTALFLGEPAGMVLTTLAETLSADDPNRAELLAFAERSPDARVSGDAYDVVRGAETAATSIIKQTETEVERFNRLKAQYQQAPDLFKQQLFFATMSDIFSQPDVKIDVLRGTGVITLSDGEDPTRAEQDSQRALERRVNQGNQPPQQ